MKRAAAVVLILLLTACAREPDGTRRQFFALGTLVDITVMAPPEKADAALRDAEQALLEFERRWRAWNEGQLAVLNGQLTEGQPVILAENIASGIRQARQLERESRGLFNPAIGKLVELWGFHQEERKAEPPPSDADIQVWLDAAPSLNDLVAENGKFVSRKPQLWLDMGAFAKGLAVNAAIEVLKKHGITDAIVNAGGDLKVLGTHGERRWRIGVRDPRGPGILAAIEVSGPVSVFTSGDYERWFEWEGRRYHHLLDPRSGYPAMQTTSLTVLHEDAARADAAATALFVAGDDWPLIARSMGIEAVMRVPAEGPVEITPAMQAYINWEDRQPEYRVIKP